MAERFEVEPKDPDAMAYTASSPDLPSLEIAEMDFTREFQELSMRR
jgi:hypothetical protein